MGEILIKKILVVDDDPTTRILYRIIIQDSHPDFEILEATNAEEAMLSIGKDKPAIIILDNRLPEMTGYLMIHKLYKEQIPHGKIIFMSGTMDELLAARAIALGATIAKEKRGIDLPQAIDEALAA